MTASTEHNLTPDAAENAFSNQRQEYRVPVIQDAEIHAILKLTDHREFAVKVLDLTDVSIHVRFTTVEHPEVPEQAVVKVVVTFQGDSLSMRGMVCRVHGRERVILFDSPVNEEDFQDAARWHTIVRTLQQLWLKSRLVRRIENS